MAATDFSPWEYGVVSSAIEICKKHNAVFHLLHVIEKNNIVGIAGNGTETVLMNSDNQDARSQLYNIYERVLQEHKIAMSIHMPAGNVFREICLAVKELDIDVLVMGAPVSTGITELFKSSMVLRAMKATGRSVLTVPGNSGLGEPGVVQ